MQMLFHFLLRRHNSYKSEMMSFRIAGMSCFLHDLARHAAHDSLVRSERYGLKWLWRLTSDHLE